MRVGCFVRCMCFGEEKKGKRENQNLSIVQRKEFFRLIEIGFVDNKKINKKNS